MNMRKVNREELGSESGAVDCKPPEPESFFPKSIGDTLLKIDGVEGVGFGGDKKLWVYVRDGNVQLKLPKQIDGYNIHVRITGIIRIQ